MTPPTDFTDEELDVLMTLARPIDRARRDAFLREVVSALAREPERGAGAAHRIGREVQRAFYDPPRMDSAGEMGSRSRTPRQGFAFPRPR
jgi:hypothetical protein